MIDGYDKVTLFERLEIGEEFIEGMSTVNEVATKTKEIVVKVKCFNARRSSGTMVRMWNWEPVFITEKLYEAIEARNKETHIDEGGSSHEP